MQHKSQQADQLLKSSAIADNPTLKTTTSEPQTRSSEFNPVYFQEKPLSPEVLILCVFGTCLLLWVVLYKRMGARKSIPPTFEADRKIQCQHCQFYSPNFYLHCAVHPSRVLKLEAMECPDYHPKSHPQSK